MAETSAVAPLLFFDLSDRAKFRVRGADRFRFLNGQITNDLRKTTDAAAIEACVLNAKGRIDAHLFIRSEPDDYLLDTDSDLRESLPTRLDRYIIADDVQVEDVTEELALFHLLATEPKDLPNEYKVVHARRFLTAGWDIWTKKSERAKAQDILLQRAVLCDPTVAENLRIESGIPRWGRELTAEIIPPEANLEERCVDYGKGCYIGQEVISRMKMSGQTNKRLCGLISPGDSPLQDTMRLHPPNEERDVGWITSAIRSERLQKNIALAFVKRGFNDTGTRLRTSTGIDVEVVPLPFL
jgi:folate-binding protein YgfZ